MRVADRRRAGAGAVLNVYTVKVGLWNPGPGPVPDGEPLGWWTFEVPTGEAANGNKVMRVAMLQMAVDGYRLEGHRVYRAVTRRRATVGEWDRVRKAWADLRKQANQRFEF